MRIIIICLLIVCIPCFLHACDNTLIKWNIGNVGLGGNLSLYDDDYDGGLEIFADAFNVMAEHRILGFGIELSPFKYWMWNSDYDYMAHNRLISFFNCGVYWNFLGWIFHWVKGGSRLILGPYVKINYLFLDNLNRINWNYYNFSFGSRFDVSLAVSKDKNIHYKIFGGEIGYRYINSDLKFYIALNVDIILAGLIYGVSFLTGRTGGPYAYE